MGSNNRKNNNSINLDLYLDVYLNKSLSNINSQLKPEQTTNFIINLYTNSNAKYKDTDINLFHKSIIDMSNILKNPYIIDLENYNPYKKNNIVLAMFLKDIIYIINKSQYNNKNFNIKVGGYFLNKLKIQKYICDLIDLYQDFKMNENLIIKDSQYYNELMILSQSYSYDNIKELSLNDINKNIDYIKKLIINSILI